MGTVLQNGIRKRIDDGICDEVFALFYSESARIRGF